MFLLNMMICFFVGHDWTQMKRIERHCDRCLRKQRYVGVEQSAFGPRPIFEDVD